MLFKRLCYLLLGCLLLTACSAGSSITSTTTDQWIILGVMNAGFPDTYAVNTNNLEIEDNLPSFVDGQIRWSSNPDWILSAESESSKTDKQPIYVVDVTSGKRIQIAEKGFNPKWDSKGKQIVYTANNDLYIIDVACLLDGDSCNPHPKFLTKGENPDWSPDGDKIVYELGTSIFVTSIAENKVSTLISGNMKCLDPDWSPDGGKILFRCWDDDNIGGFYLANENGTDVSKIIGTDKLSGSDPTWSPSGEKIAFTVFTGFGLGEAPRSSLYMMNSDGKDVVRLTSRKDENVLWFSWIPSSTSLEGCRFFCK